LVEDEILVGMLATEYLDEMGYKVEMAGSATDALNKAKLFKGAIDLAIVDMGLPDRGGDVLVRELRALFPAMPIVIASGYAEADLRKRFGLDPNIAYVAKPYTREQLQSLVPKISPLTS
jgi:CheY-like chemotaxis protein